MTLMFRSYHLKVKPLPTYESCLEGKMTEQPFPSKRSRATKFLELVHNNVWNSIHVQARVGYKYFTTFTDDFSKYGYMYLMHREPESFEIFKEFKAQAKRQLRNPLKAQ